MNATETPATMRGHALASIHAAANMIATDDELPTPGSVEIRFHQHTGNAAERAAYVEAFAERYGLTVIRREGSSWAELPIATRGAHGVDITYTVSTHGEDRPL